MAQPSAPTPAPNRRVPFVVGLVLAAVICACSVYANLSFAVTRPVNFQYFPPFRPYVSGNMNHHLGAEYFNIAQALAAGDGFANPFKDRTGPTAWMPPALPALLAGLLWACDGNRDAVMAVVVFLQVYVLIVTGLLVLALARRTTRRVGAVGAATVFFLALLCEFKSCFQVTHDSWLVLLALDLLVAGLCWCRPLQRRWTAAGWGLFGGLCALTSPVVGFTWGVLSLLRGWRERAWSRLALAVLAAGVALAPWTVRNYLVFGRLIPVKSNLAYELYQSQCLQPDGLIRRSTFFHHPGRANSQDGQEYRVLGEAAFLDRKRQQFRQAVWADPVDYLDRAACRFLGVALWYEPFDRLDPVGPRSWALWLGRLIHPLPFLAVLVLVFTAVRERLHPTQCAVIGVYCFYLLPYIGASYYDRYGAPLLGVKVLLVIWAVDWLLCLVRKEGRNDWRAAGLVPAVRTAGINRAARRS